MISSATNSLLEKFCRGDGENVNVLAQNPASALRMERDENQDKERTWNGEIGTIT